MMLEMSCNNSSGGITRIFDIKLFYVANLVERKEVATKY